MRVCISCVGDVGVGKDAQCVFFFFKQKTAYEMRISDWSSDVCSSDLSRHRQSNSSYLSSSSSEVRRVTFVRFGDCIPAKSSVPPAMMNAMGRRLCFASFRQLRRSTEDGFDDAKGCVCHSPTQRSEEHTSELQSLMRISYAVFCLKKKK